MSSRGWDPERRQNLRVGIRDWSAWERIALVIDDARVRDGLPMPARAVPGEVKPFPAAEGDDVVAWAAAVLERPPVRASLLIS